MSIFVCLLNLGSTNRNCDEKSKVVHVFINHGLSLNVFNKFWQKQVNDLKVMGKKRELLYAHGGRYSDIVNYAPTKCINSK